MSFAAFIMTYKRPETAQITITKLFEQTRKPDKVLIIDNDPDLSGKILMNNLPEFPLGYYPMNYNSGPAGAAAKGLELLANQGYDWIAWIDDDDPPVFNDSFEILLDIAVNNKNCGSVGAVGQYFSRMTGLIKLVPDQLLKHEGFIKVDTIGGGMVKIVNGKMVHDYKIYPNKDLFFGLEELDFDLKIRENNFNLFVSTILFKQHREYFKEYKIKTISKNKKDISKTWRLYYSLRNSLYVYSGNKLYLALFVSVIRYFLKIVLSYKYGFKYFLMNLKYTIKGFYHFIINRKGILV